jgi:hypothetical protein
MKTQVVNVALDPQGCRVGTPRTEAFGKPWDISTLNIYEILYPWGYLLVNIQKTNWNITMLLMGKSLISAGPFSRANCLFTRG